MGYKKILLLSLTCLLAGQVAYASDTTDSIEKVTQSMSEETKSSTSAKEETTTESSSNQIKKMIDSASNQSKINKVIQSKVVSKDGKKKEVAKTKDVKQQKNTRASFNLADWDYDIVEKTGEEHEGSIHTDTYVVLRHYKGTNKDVILPGWYNGPKPGKWPMWGKQYSQRDGAPVWLEGYNGNNSTIFPKAIESIRVESTDPTKQVITSGKLDLFDGCTKLKSADLSGLNTVKATSFENMFRGCSSLTKVSDLGYFSMFNVKSVKSMFEGCKSLTRVDITLQDAPTVTDLSRMFYDTPNLNYINLDGFTPRQSDLKTTDMFRCETNSPLLVDVSNTSSAATNLRDILSNYNFGKDNRIVPGPWLDANGGVFSNGERIISYWPKCVILNASQKDLSKLNNFKKAWKPKKSGAIFRDWVEINPPINPSNPNGMLHYLNTIFKAQYDLIDPSTSPDNTKIPSTKDILSFVYYPTKFNIDDTILNESGEQSIKVKRKQTFNVGVRYGGSAREWTLNGQLIWNNPKKDQGIQLRTNDAKATINDNTTSYYNPDKLLPVPNTITCKKQLTLNDSSQVVMQNTSLGTDRGIFDYGLGNLQMYLKDAGKVQAGSHTGKVRWNLVVAP